MAEQSPGGQGPRPALPPGTTAAVWWQRVAAFVVDTLVLVPFSLLALLGGSLSGDTATALGSTLLVVGNLGAVVFAVWNNFFRQGATGRTVGKQALGIRMVSIRDGEPIGAGLTVVRYLAHVLDVIPLYVGFLWPLWDRKRQTFADKVMSTVVLRDEERAGGPAPRSA